MSASSRRLPDRAVDVADIARRCRIIVRKRALASATVALVPIPGLDMVADYALLARMIERINREFELTPEQIDELDSRTRMRVYRSISGIGGSMVGQAVTRALLIRLLQAAGVRLASRSIARVVPLAGQAVSASLAFAAVHYVGERHVRDCLRVRRALRID